MLDNSQWRTVAPENMEASKMGPKSILPYCRATQERSTSFVAKRLEEGSLAPSTSSPSIQSQAKYNFIVITTTS